MGAVKSMVMDLEEKCFDQLTDEIGECEDISDAQFKAMKIFKENNLLDYIGADYLEESVSEIWAEKWSKYNV
jgi:hypothetical protein